MQCIVHDPDRDSASAKAADCAQRYIIASDDYRPRQAATIPRLEVKAGLVSSHLTNRKIAAQSCMMPRCDE